MKNSHLRRNRNSEGFATINGVIVYLVLGSLALGSVLVMVGNVSKQEGHSQASKLAFNMAEAGVAAAIADRNSGGSGAIDKAASKSRFNSTAAMRGDWGFTTTATTNGAAIDLRSVGFFGNKRSVVTAQVRNENLNIHRTYTYAIYAGNSDNDAGYTMDFGGSGADADIVVGDVYVNGDIDISGDAQPRNPEDFVDVNGNGIYDIGEPYTDVHASNLGSFPMFFTNPVEQADLDDYRANVNLDFAYRNGVYDFGEPFVDTIGNGIYDPGETYTDANTNGVYDVGEAYIDQNGVFDVGEDYVDVFNGVYDNGTDATGFISGMPSAGPGQTVAGGSSAVVPPPDLVHQYYQHAKSDPDIWPTLPNASANAGHDVNVAAGPFNGAGKIMDATHPAHFFVKNPGDREDSNDQTPGDDYYFEDPTQGPVEEYTGPVKFINVLPQQNHKVYYVDGNLWLHNYHVKDFQFLNPGTHITIVAKGNVYISDDFNYNWNGNSPMDTLSLIAMKNSAEPDSGNIYMGDANFGTIGDIQAMLYAENNFVDRNVVTDESTLVVYGTMSAGNQILIARDADDNHTKLQVTLDERVRAGMNQAPGLPLQGDINFTLDSGRGWRIIPGSWNSFSPLDTASASL